MGAAAVSERPRVALIVASASLRSSANNATPRALGNPGTDPKADLNPLKPASSQVDNLSFRANGVYGPPFPKHAQGAAIN